MRTIQSEIGRHGLHRKTAITKCTEPSKGKEFLSRKEIEELMGLNRQIYRRVNGALRRK
ncbi:hypothetical protein [Lysinibacillus sp. 3P01SB]|uniref:hypothetical protein n=1 Tax=Lysinibacillus sp. 3P01SB TaxID=3132284 RepID=UPI0039A42140